MSVIFDLTSTIINNEVTFAPAKGIHIPIPSNTNKLINSVDVCIAKFGNSFTNNPNQVFVELWEVTVNYSLRTRVGTTPLSTSSTIAANDLPSYNTALSGVLTTFTFPQYTLDSTKNYSIIIRATGPDPEFGTAARLLKTNNDGFTLFERMSNGSKEFITGTLAVRLQEYIPPPTITNIVNADGKTFGIITVDPTQTAVTINGQGLPTGSIVKYSVTGQKFIKVDGSNTSYEAIPVTPPANWNWSQELIDAWAVLNSF